MAPKPGHWLSYGDRQRDKGGMQMQSPGSQKKKYIYVHIHTKNKKKKKGKNEKRIRRGIPGPASAADMIYALMSRFFDKVLNL